MKVRLVEKRDLEQYKALTDIQGWNRGMEIFEMLLDRCPKGNFCVELEDGELVSFCGGFEMDETSIQIHSFITNIKYRGKGYGLTVFNAMVDAFKGKTFYINSAAGKEPMYAKSGFTKFIYQDLRIIAIPKCDIFEKLQSFDFSLIEETGMDNYDDICEFDEQICPINRRTLLDFYLETARFKLVSRDSEGKVNGYVFARDITQNDLSQGISLQPFYADNSEIAEKLLLRVIQLSSGVKIQASAPVLNSNFFNLIDQYFEPNYFKDGNTNLTMGNEYSLDLEKIYGMLDYTTSIC